MNPTRQPGDAPDVVVPQPDPTSLTTAQLVREIAALREILDSKIEGKSEIVGARFDGMDRAIKLLQVIFDRVPSDIDKAVATLERLHEEKFRSIATQFSERDVRAEQTSRDSKVAVDAALQAAKEAVGKQNEASDRAISKSETATTKQIDQQGLLIASVERLLKDSIDETKERVTRIESQGIGEKTAKVTQQTSNTGLVGIVGLVIGSLIALASLLYAIMKP